MKLKNVLTATELGQLDEIQSVLVTGASGVIGSSFIALLLELRTQGLFTGSIACVSNSRPVSSLDPTKGDVSMAGDLTDSVFLSSLPTADLVFHAASPSAPQEFMARPLETITLNVEVTRVLKGLARLKFIFSSSSEVYSGLSVPATELDLGTTNTLHPRAAYIESKKVGEVITLSTVESPTVPEGYAFRIALAYGFEGVNLEDTRLLYDLVRKGLTTGKIELRQGGSMIRSYCFAPDLLLLMLGVALRSGGGIYNIGHEEPLEIRTIAKMVAKATGASFLEVSDGSEVATGAPQVVSMDFSRLHELYPHFPYTSFETGLNLLVSQFRVLLASRNEGAQ